MQRAFFDNDFGSPCIASTYTLQNSLSVSSARIMSTPFVLGRMYRSSFRLSGARFTRVYTRREHGAPFRTSEATIVPCASRHCQRALCVSCQPHEKRRSGIAATRITVRIANFPRHYVAAPVFVAGNYLHGTKADIFPPCLRRFEGAAFINRLCSHHAVFGVDCGYHVSHQFCLDSQAQDRLT